MQAAELKVSLERGLLEKALPPVKLSAKRRSRV